MTSPLEINPIFTLDTNWCLVYINAEGQRLVGMSQGEVLGKTIWEVFPSTMGTLLETEYRRAMTGRVAVEFDNYHQAWDRWFSIRVYPKPDGGISVILEDMTKRKQAEEALRESEEKYRLLFESANDALLVANEFGKYIDANRRAEELLGYPRKELLRMRVNDITPDKISPIGEARYEEFKRVGRMSGEYTIVRKNGTKADVEFSANRIAQGRYLSSLRDVTARKQAEEALRKSEERFRRYFELGLIGMAITTLNKKCLEVNDQLCQMLGYQRDELLQKTWLELTHPDDVAADLAQFDRVLAGQSDGYSLDKRFIRKDGKVVHAIISVKCLRRADGSIDYFVALIQDITERKRAEEALRVKENELEVIFRQTPVMLTRCSRDMRYRYVSRAYAKMLDRTPEQIAGKPIVEIIGEEAYQTILPYIKAVLDGQPVEYETLINFNNKGGGFLRVNYVPDKDERGQVIGWVATIFDITEQKAAEEKIRRSEALLSEAQQVAHIGSWNWEIETNTVVWSDEHYRIFGLKPQSGVMTYERFLSLVHPEDRATVQERIAESFASGEPYESCFRALQEDGTVRIVQSRGNVIFDKDEKPLRMYGTVQDITERKQWEEALAESEERLRQLVSLMPTGIYTCDSKGRLTFYNRHAAKLWGWEPKLNDESVKFCGAFRLWNTDGSPVRNDQTPVADAIFKGTSVRDLEVVAEQPNGERVIMSINVDPIHDREGRRIGAINVFQDITGRKKAEESIRQYAEELKRSNSDLGQFATIVSHDLKEPLRTISNYAQLLSLKYKDQLDAKGGHFISQILESTRKMSDLIQDLLLYSQAGKKTNNFKEINTQGLCEKAIKSLEISIKESGAQITCHGLPHIFADEIQIVQLLQNLISNAIKFRSQRRLVIDIRAKVENNEHIFSVSDNGIGIAPQYFTRIFEIFRRLHTEEEYPGTGIGLSICKKFVDNHNGRIWVESEPGRGTTFYFSIPIKEIKKDSDNPQ